MPTELATPVVLPAVPERTFPHVWWKGITINATVPPTAENPTPVGSITVEGLPYNAQTGDMTNGQNTIVLNAPLWETIAAVPEVAAAMDAILTGIAALQTHLAASQE